MYDEGIRYSKKSDLETTLCSPSVFFHTQHLKVEKKYRDVDGEDVCVRCVRPLGGILGVVWQIYKYRKEVNTEEKMKITRKDDQ